MTTHRPQPALVPTRRPLTVALALVSLAAMASCGGGSSNTSANASGIGSGGTGSFTVGTISGFGSIIVNGVRYSYTDDLVSSLDGDRSTQFQLGMVVEVKSDEAPTTVSGSSTVTATAKSIRVGTALIGPVGGAVDTASGTFTVLGQTVQTSINTFYDASNNARLAGVGGTRCPYVKVYGLPRTKDLGYGFAATRVECLTTQPPIYRLSGVVTAVNAMANPRTIEISGSSTLTLASGVATPTEGQALRVEVPSSSSSPSWTVTRISDDERAIPTTSQAARIEGQVSDYVYVASGATSGHCTFLINGLPVQYDIPGAQVPASLGNNQTISVKGTVSNGVLVATEIEAESDYDTPDTSDGTGAQREIELHGSSANIQSLNTNARTFVFKSTQGDVRVSYTSAVLSDLDAAGLRTATAIEIHGVRASDGVGIVATEIDLGDY